MNRFKNILCIVTGQTGDAAALNRAVELAKANDSKLTVLSLYTPISATSRLFIKQERASELNSALEEKARADLNQLVAELEPSLVQPLVQAADSPFETILLVLKHKYDLVIKCKEDIGEPTLSSADMRLLRKCPCPVWFINDAKKQRFKRILVAVDVDPSENERWRLHTELLKMGTTLAEREKAQLDILCAWQAVSEATLSGPRLNMNDSEIAAFQEEQKATHQGWLDELMEPFQTQSVDIHTHLIRGPAHKVILEFIEQNAIDLLLMGTVARTGIPGLIIGNTAESVLGKAKTGILTVKPPGFKSPVSL